MDPAMFVVYLGGVVLIITVIMWIPGEWKVAIGGLMILLLIADSVIAGLRALLR